SVYEAGGSMVRQVPIADYVAAGINGLSIVSIPLDILLGSNPIITRVQLQEASGSPQPTFFIDNFGFAPSDDSNETPIGEGPTTFTVNTTATGADASPGDGQ